MQTDIENKKEVEDKGKYGYRIVEENENPGDNVIEKSGIAIKFTLNDIEQNIRDIEKKVKELQGKLDIEAAKCANIEEHHPFVKELGDEKGKIVHLYQESRAYVRQIPAVIEDLKHNVEDLKAERAQIEKVCGVAVPRIVLDASAVEALKEAQEPTNEQEG
jgi:DNA-directed RNA polymerase subunit H (RpoH/RPB5)